MGDIADVKTCIESNFCIFYFKGVKCYEKSDQIINYNIIDCFSIVLIGL